MKAKNITNREQANRKCGAPVPMVASKNPKATGDGSLQDDSKKELDSVAVEVGVKDDGRPPFDNCECDRCRLTLEMVKE
jgi:hypothetical protein